MTFDLVQVENPLTIFSSLTGPILLIKMFVFTTVGIPNDGKIIRKFMICDVLCKYWITVDFEN